jgi:hypothetical protein
MQKDSNIEYEKLLYSYMSWDHKYVYTMVVTVYVSFLLQKTSIIQCTISVVSETNLKPLKLILPDCNVLVQLHRLMFHNSIE